MDQDANQMQATPTLCRSGCGFYGNSSFDGMCSKCYKDSIKKKQSPPNSGCLSPGSSSHSAITTPSLPTSPTGRPTIPTLVSTLPQEQQQSEKEKDASPQISDVVCSSPSEEADGKKKKNRCGVCKKKVGLTGFSCRCGGLFCSMHRYSDEHECPFDYRQLGADEIRKNNPVVIGEKISKI